MLALKELSLKRLFQYCSEMFRPTVYIPGGIISFIGPYVVYIALTGIGFDDFIHSSSGHLGLLLRAIGGISTTILFMLLLRMMDEVKDSAHDLKYFPNRPVPRGVISLNEIKIWVQLIGFVMLGINFLLGLTVGLPVMVMGFILTGFGFLMYVNFFSAHVRNNMTWAFITHNPATVVLHAYYLSYVIADFGLTQISSNHAVAILLFWMPVFAWEIARKIKAPSDETGQYSYSLHWGLHKSVNIIIASLIFQIILMIKLAAFFMSKISNLQIIGYIGLFVWIMILLRFCFVLLKFQRQPVSRPVGFRAESEILLSYTNVILFTLSILALANTV